VASKVGFVGSHIWISPWRDWRRKEPFSFSCLYLGSEGRVCCRK